MLKNIFFIQTILCLAATELKAQQLPIGHCGIVNVYDNAGNRIRRVYFCNNGIDPYPAKGSTIQPPSENVTEKNETMEVQEADALYPNPTTGKFYVTFSKPLVNAAISITDNNGKILIRFNGNGNRTAFDLSPYPAGVYYIRIEQDGRVITKKVIKQ